MKPKWYIFLFMAPIIFILAFILIGAGTGKPGGSNATQSTGQFLSQTKNLQPEIVPGVVAVKIKSATAAQTLVKASTITGLSSLDAKLQRFGATSVQKMFRHKPIPPNFGIPDISRILKVRIPERMNPVMVVRELEGDPNVEYAEPVYVRRLAAVPNDPMYAQQQHLPQIHAPEAWDVQKGDSSVIIAIVDTGVDYDHEDLAANVWTNELEANGVTGVDDDGNGFVDDIHGWDFVNDDADPTDPYGHGTHCAGIACAVTNNRTGIAGVSWNCRYMPVRSIFSNVENTSGYEGIIYAVDNGADVISNSWGWYGFLKWEQEVINYANSKGVIIVGAACNDNGELPFYPASYQHAISVASVRVNDTKAGYSNFGPWIDICAPGGSQGAFILSTIPDNKYEAWGGTSMAAPVVAGVCGLVKSLHPDWSNDQIVRQVLLTADNIDALNPQYRNKLGHGRVNAFRALTDSPSTEPDARLALPSFSTADSLYGNNNGVLDRGETIQVRFNVQNCSIGGTETATLRLSSANPAIEITNGTIGPTSFPADTTLPFDFNFKIAGDAPAQKTELILRLETGRGYSREEKVQISIGMMPLLLVDHDYGHWQQSPAPDVELFFRDILDKNGILYRFWDPGFAGFESKTLQASPIVILSCSWWGGQIIERERNALRTYLDGGGNLFVCGQDIGNYLFEANRSEEAKAFLRDYLHAEYIADDSEDHEVKGMEGDPISQGMSFHVWQPGLSIDQQFPEVIAPTAGASTIFTYRDGRAGAVKYAGNHKVVYLGFGLEAVDSRETTKIGDPSPIRTELLMRILNWLNFIEHEPLKDIAETDSSRTVVARITGNVTDLQNVTLFWRLHGDENFNLIAMTESDSGFYSAKIPAPGKATKIEYYLQTKHPYYDWQSPIGAPDTMYSYQVGVTSVDETAALPVEFQLRQNYPNPFNPSTTIEFALPKASFVTLKIYDLLGNEVATLVAEKLPAGKHQRVWEAKGLASGVYLLRLEADDPSTSSGRGLVQSRKLVLLR